jgi:thioesterase domain-containing protein
MQRTPVFSKGKPALLTNHLRGELPQTKAAVSTSLRVKAQSENASANTCITLLQSGCKTPFFFLHGDWTGNSFFCFKLAHALGPDQPFYILDVYNFEPYQVLPSLETIAAEQLAMIREVQPEGPYLLGGFCNGGVIVYEMARQLYSSGQKVDLLVLIDAQAPLYPKTSTIVRLVGPLLHIKQEKQLILFLRLQHLFLYLTGQVTKSFHFIKTTDPRVISCFPPVETLRKEFSPMFTWAMIDYKPTFYPDKVTLFWTEADPSRMRQWQKMAEGKDREVEVHLIPGSHTTCKTEHLDSMAERLQRCLQKAQNN